jgi:hypothetical protein
MYRALLVEIKTIYKMHGTYIKIEVHLVVLTLFIYVQKQP